MAHLSRFYRRWLNGDPVRAVQIQALAKLSLSAPVFEDILQKETAAGLPLPRAMRRLRNVIVASLIERDLNGRADLAQVLATMTALAEFAVQTQVAALSAELTLVHGTPIGRDSGMAQTLIVIGMGKLGGAELNVSSDIDLIFCYAEEGDTQTTSADQRQLSNHEFFTRLGKKLIGALAEITEDGFTFRVDMALRPNGASGPLVASFGMLEAYLIMQGREWERYAWIKARAITGHASDIAALEKIVTPFVYRRYLDFGAIDAMRNMHAQIRAEVTRQEMRHPDRNHHVKLGRGGIREIEFLAQVFQLIRGGRDVALRERSTRGALRILAEQGLLSSPIVDQLCQSYTFLRNLEHRLQYLDDAQTHTLPANEADRLVIAQMMGYADVATLLHALASHRDFVAAQFDAMFREKNHDHAVEPVASSHSIPPLTLADTQETTEAHFTMLGFTHAADDAKRLLATWQSPRLRTLPESSRQKLVALINAALPMIANLAPARAGTLGNVLDFFEAIARRAAYLALLTEYPCALERVISIMHASEWAAHYLTQHPLLLDELLEQKSLTATPDWVAFKRDCQRQLDSVSDDTERQMDILREMHHAQLFQLLAQDLAGNLTVERLADHLSALADALVALTVQQVWHTITNRHQDAPRFAVIAYGKLGGLELGYASDLDLIFLYDDDHPDAPSLYAKLAQRFITWMTSHTAAGVLFDIDIALRPDGASGLLVSTLSAFEKYERDCAWIWEHQALTRARFCAGDAAIGSRFETIRKNVLRQSRDPDTLKREVLAMRKRLHEAHPNRSALFDVKHDAGGMIDIEFIVQFFVLRYAAQYPQLTANIGNIALLTLCGELGLADPALTVDVANAYRTFRKVQHQMRLQGKARSHIEAATVSLETTQVKRLWTATFNAHPA